jgi:hypothetical protein
VQRKTLAEYEEFVYGLCGMPPGDERDDCARRIVRQLCSMYVERGVAPPYGLHALAEKVGVQAGDESA